MWSQVRSVPEHEVGHQVLQTGRVRRQTCTSDEKAVCSFLSEVVAGSQSRL